MASQLSAIELLKLGNEGREPPFLNKHWANILGVFFGLASGVVINWGTRRPLFSGIQKHIIFVASWTALLNYVQYRRDISLAERDAILLHYIELHPEDFPTPERKKIGDIFEPWAPIR